MPKHLYPRQNVATARELSRHLCCAISFLSGVWLMPAMAQDNQGTLDNFSDKHFIIGGEPVLENTDAPWIVALANNNNAELFQRQFCAGSIIADRWVLTAAHCMVDRVGGALDVSEFSVVVNAANLRGGTETELMVSNIILHPEYEHNAINPHSDIALLELAIATDIEPVVLSTKQTDELIGLTATISGWGAVVYDDPERPLFPVVLHTVDVPVVSIDVCNSPVSYDGQLQPNQLCAGLAQGGRDSCVGDSGGPMVVNVQGQPQQAGIVSFGFGCALPNFYGVYTDIPYFIGWINQYVFVGEPEYEPEQLKPREFQAANGIASGGGADAGSLNWLLVPLTAIGLIRRRRLK